MTIKRKIGVFSPGCPGCDEAVELVESLACPSCEVTLLDMYDAVAPGRFQDNVNLKILFLAISRRKRFHNVGVKPKDWRADDHCRADLRGCPQYPREPREAGFRGT